MLSAGDHRHRAPFAHQSSSLDLYAQNSQYTPYSDKFAYANGSGSAGAPPAGGAGPQNGFSSLFGGLSADSLSASLGSGDGSLASRVRDSLPNPTTVKFILLCTLWYASSAVSSNTGKVILNRARFPITLTIVQFAFVSGLCWLISRRQLGLGHRLRRPTRQIVVHTLPMAAFQVGGHIFGSLAISRVPVSTVHSIKVSNLPPARRAAELPTCLRHAVQPYRCTQNLCRLRHTPDPPQRYIDVYVAGTAWGPPLPITAAASR